MRAKTSMLLTLVALILGSFLAIAVPATSAAPADKVTICHKPGTSAENEISVSRNALPAHEAHGDYEGECAPVTPPLACNQTALSGGEGTTTTVHQLGITGPTSFQLTYDMVFQPDQLEVFYEGNLIYTTGGFVSGTNTVTVNVPVGTATTVTVTVSAPEPGTVWSYTVFCPATS